MPAAPVSRVAADMRNSDSVADAGGWARSGS